MAPRSSMIGLLAVFAMVALTAPVALAAKDMPEQHLHDFSSLLDFGNSALGSAEEQHRSLLATAPCPNANIKETFTAKIAVLLQGVASRPGKRTEASDYLELLNRTVKRRLDRYNRTFKLRPALYFSYRIISDGSVPVGTQKWFYYYVTFSIGRCGKYKSTLVTQLKTDIQPSAPFVKAYRVLSYPYKA